MSDEAPAGFEEPLLETRQGPVLDGHGENEPAQESAEAVGDPPEEQPHLIGPEPVTGEAGPVGGGLTLLDPLLGRPGLGVEADDCSVRPHQRGDDEAYSGKQFTEVMLDLGDHAARTVAISFVTIDMTIPCHPAPGIDASSSSSTTLTMARSRRQKRSKDTSRSSTARAAAAASCCNARSVASILSASVARSSMSVTSPSARVGLRY